MKKTASVEMDDSNAALFDARNFFYIGNFMGSVNTVLPEQSTGSAELLAYSYYSYLAIDSARIIGAEVKENNTTALAAFRQLHDYWEKPEKRDEIVQFFIDKLSHGNEGSSDGTNIWLIAGSIVFCREGLYESALKSLHGNNDLECMAIAIYCLLKMNRVDLAKPLLAKMQEKSDDATLTQLTQAWIGIVTGGEQLQDAYHIFQEFCDKYSPTPLLLNGQAICHIGQDKYDEADDVLKESLAKKHNDYDTLVNLVVLSHLMGKSAEVSSRYIEQLKQFYPQSAFCSDLTRKQDEFDRLCLQYQESNRTSSIY